MGEGSESGQPDLGRRGATILKSRLTTYAATAVFVGILAVAALPAHATVQRYQFETITATVTVNGIYDHSYIVTVNPCDGTFQGTGQYPATGPATFTESISGSQVNGVLNYTAAYTNAPPYAYSLVNGTFSETTGAFSGSGTDTNGTSLTITGQASTPTDATNYQNHGDFVKAQPDKNDAAHSCIGMPVQSHQ